MFISKQKAVEYDNSFNFIPINSETVDMLTFGVINNYVNDNGTISIDFIAPHHIYETKKESKNRLRKLLAQKAGYGPYYANNIIDDLPSWLFTNRHTQKDWTVKDFKNHGLSESDIVNVLNDASGSHVICHFEGYDGWFVANQTFLCSLFDKLNLSFNSCRYTDFVGRKVDSEMISTTCKVLESLADDDTKNLNLFVVTHNNKFISTVSEKYNHVSMEDVVNTVEDIEKYGYKVSTHTITPERYMIMLNKSSECESDFVPGIIIRNSNIGDESFNISTILKIKNTNSYILIDSYKINHKIVSSIDFKKVESLINNIEICCNKINNFKKSIDMDAFCSYIKKNSDLGNSRINIIENLLVNQKEMSSYDFIKFMFSVPEVDFSKEGFKLSKKIKPMDNVTKNRIRKQIGTYILDVVINEVAV